MLSFVLIADHHFILREGRTVVMPVLEHLKDMKTNALAFPSVVQYWV